jgi:hypothetical protein
MSAPARNARFLSPNRISELVWDSENEEAGAQSDSSSEEEESFEDEPGVSRLQPNRPTSSGQAVSSSLSSASDEDEVFQSGQGQQVQTPSPSQWTRPSGPQRSVVNTFTGNSRGKRESEAPQINEGSSPLSVFLLYFAEIINCSWWNLTDTTTLTDLTKDLHP